MSLISSTILPKKHFIFISDVATYIGQNKWNIITPFERLWKKTDKKSLDSILDLIGKHLIEQNVKICHLKTQLDELEQQFLDKKITKRQLDLYQGKLNKEIDELQKYSELLHDNMDSFVLNQGEKIQKEFGEEVTSILRDLTISNDVKKKLTKDVIDKFDNTNSGFVLTNKKKEEYKTEIESMVNKDHGVRNEDTAIGLYEKQNNCKLDVSQSFYKKLVFTGKSGDEWYICGKMDGINHKDGYIVEVKNRTKSFFAHLRDYEKTQMQMYMYMTDMELTKLVECKIDSKTTIKTTDVEFDKDYVEDSLFKLKEFLSSFETFLASDLNQKKKYLLMDRDAKEWFIHKMYHSYLTSSKQTKRTAQEVDCLLGSSDDTDSSDELS